VWQNECGVTKLRKQNAWCVQNQVCAGTYDLRAKEAESTTSNERGNAAERGVARYEEFREKKRSPDRTVKKKQHKTPSIIDRVITHGRNAENVRNGV